MSSDPQFCAKVAEKVLGASRLEHSKPIPEVYFYQYQGRMILHPKGDFACNRYFEPDTDANDDYLVLKHVRENWRDEERAESFFAEMAYICSRRVAGFPTKADLLVCYEVGDYSRAALQVVKALAQHAERG